MAEQQPVATSVRLDRKWSLQILKGEMTALYNLDTDKHEARNLLSEEPEVAQEIFDAYRPRSIDLQPVRARYRVKRKTLRQLKALGYAQ